jgi:hypothetical protein
MLELKSNQLVFSFPEVHPDARLTITLHRTFRIPDDGKKYPLPPSCGFFPVRHVDDFKDKVPEKWVGRGGVMVPLYQSEALWLAFDPQYSNLHMHHYAFAIKVATGKVSALTGKKWSKKLKDGDYMVSPGQPWLDGYVVDGGTIRQFVAAPLGLGVTAEEQITGEAEFGGLQIEVVPMDQAKFEARWPKRPPPPPNFGGGFGRRIGGGGLLRSAVAQKKSALPVHDSYKGAFPVPAAAGASNYSATDIKVLSADEARAKRPEMYREEKTKGGVHEGVATMDFMSLDRERGVEIGEDSLELSEVNLDMGLAAGGKMEQQIFKDPFGLSDWSSTVKSRCYVHMCNSLGWEHLTGTKPPTIPMTSAHYASKGFPWFKYYEEGAKSLSGTEKTKGLKSVAEFQKEKKTPILPENQSVQPGPTVVLKSSLSEVRDGLWK